LKNDLSRLIQLEHNCKQCENDTELYYILVNQTRQLVDYEQAVLLAPSLNGKLSAVSISDMTTVDATSPYVQFVEELSNYYLAENPEEINSVHTVDHQRLIDLLKKRSKEYIPENTLWIPLKTIKNNIEIEYYLILFRKKGFQDKELQILQHIATSYQYFLFSMRKCSFKTTLQNWKIQSKYLKWVLLGMFLLMLFPVRMSVLAPFEVQAKDPFVVTSPLEGAIDKIMVAPNQHVKKDQLLVKIKDTDLKNNYEIAKRKLDTVKAQLHTIQQAGFFDPDKKSQTKRLLSEVSLKEAELNFAKSQLDKTNIVSTFSGIAIIKNPNEWEGRPVVTGERVFLIAQKEKIELKIMLSVNDALFLQEHSEVKLFIDNKIFESWDATVSHISYEPELTPENILSYKLIADFNDLKQHEQIPSIGLRGTAKIYSENVTLFFYLFRKPLTGLRQWIGW
jgi:hypothetical protein